MYWDDLNKDNIEEVKELYNDYIQDNKDETFVANLMSFEEFMQNKLVKCSYCDNWVLDDTARLTINNQYLCQCCSDDEEMKTISYDEYMSDIIHDEQMLERCE